MKKYLFIIILLILFSCDQTRKEYLIDKNLKIAPHRQGATSRSLAIFDFSVAEGTEHFFGSIPLELCRCILNNDTLTVAIGYRSESVQSPVFNITQNTYTSYVLFNSDIDEYNGSYTMKIKTSNDRLTLNKSSFIAGDTLIGQFLLESDTIQFNQWNEPIHFEGRFQCIIKNQNE